MKLIATVTDREDLWNSVRRHTKWKLDSKPQTSFYHEKFKLTLWGSQDIYPKKITWNHFHLFSSIFLSTFRASNQGYFVRKCVWFFYRKTWVFCKHWACLEIHLLAKIRILLTLERYLIKRYNVLLLVLFYDKALTKSSDYWATRHNLAIFGSKNGKIVRIKAKIQLLKLNFEWLKIMILNSL